MIRRSRCERCFVDVSDGETRCFRCAWPSERRRRREEVQARDSAWAQLELIFSAEERRRLVEPGAGEQLKLRGVR